MRKQISEAESKVSSSSASASTSAPVPDAAASSSGPIPSGGDSTMGSPQGKKRVASKEAADQPESKAMALNAVTTGCAEFDPGQLAKAKQLEVKRLDEFGVYTPIHLSKVPQGNRPIATRWVLVQKDPTLVRARLVAKDFNTSGTTIKSADFFAPTPSLAALRLLLSLFARNRRQGWVLRTADVSVAFLHAKIPAGQRVFVVPPRDLGLADGYVWELHRTLYGLRTAPKEWSDHLCTELQSLGLKRSATEPCVYAGLDVMLVVHVDDLCVTGTREAVNKLFASLTKHLLIKVGTDLSSSNSVEFLGRTISLKDNTVTLRCSDKLVGKLASLVGLLPGASNAVPTPMVKELGLDSEEAILDSEGQSKYRSGVGLGLYLAADRMDAQYTIKELSRRLNKATQSDWEALKRLARYLSGTSNYCLHYNGAWDSASLSGYSDANWATCRETRRSTSGIVITLGKDIIYTASKTQTSVALSSGESELYAANALASELLYLTEVVRESFPSKLVSTRPPAANIDASATLGIVGRLGCGGRTKHIAVRELWMQEKLREKALTIAKIPRAVNPSDMLTHASTQSELQKFTRMLQLVPSDILAVCTLKLRYRKPLVVGSQWS